MDGDTAADWLRRRAARLQHAASQMQRLSDHDARKLLRDIAADDARALLRRRSVGEATAILKTVENDVWRTDVIAELIRLGRACAERLHERFQDSDADEVQEADAPSKESFEARMISQSAEWESALKRCFDGNGNYIEGRGLDVELLKEYASDVEKCADTLMGHANYQIAGFGGGGWGGVGQDWADIPLAEEAQGAAEAATMMLDELEKRDLIRGRLLPMHR